MENGIQPACAIVGISKIRGASPSNPTIKLVIVCEYRRTRGQCFNEGWVGATDLMAVDVEACMKAQGAHNGFVVDSTREKDLVACGF